MAEDIELALTALGDAIEAGDNKRAKEALILVLLIGFGEFVKLRKACESIAASLNNDNDSGDH